MMARVIRLPGSGSGQLLQLRIELAWLKPAIWRRIVVPESIMLGKLHKVIQVAMGWTDSHLHEFEIGHRRYGIPDPDWDFGDAVMSEKRVPLANSLAGAKSFRYTYDFGDGWEHRIKVEKILPPQAHAHALKCVAGANACPPEDVGGAPGYSAFLDAISNPEHPNHADMLDWCGGGFDPTAFDIDAVNKRLLLLKP